MILVFVLLLVLGAVAWVFNAQVSSVGGSSVVRKVVEKERAFVLLKSAVPSVKELLDRYANGGLVSLGDPWAKPMVVPTPLGEVEVEVVDLERFLNLNAIDKRGVRETLKNLLRELEIDAALLEKLLVWEGLEPYADTDFEYPPPRRPLSSEYELLLIWNAEDLGRKRRGFEELPALTELTTTLSEGRINVNTAPIWIIRALPGIDPATAEAIVELRQRKVIKDLKELLGVGSIDMNVLYRWREILTTRSRNFLVKLRLKGKLTLWFVYDVVDQKIVAEGVE
jgi:general secretion pathway protein K